MKELKIMPSLVPFSPMIMRIAAMACWAAGGDMAVP